MESKKQKELSRLKLGRKDITRYLGISGTAFLACMLLSLEFLTGVTFSFVIVFSIILGLNMIKTKKVTKWKE